MNLTYRADPENPVYSKILSKREAKQVIQSMEIRARITRQLAQAKRFEQVQYEKNIGNFVAKLEQRWK